MHACSISSPRLRQRRLPPGPKLAPSRLPALPHLSRGSSPAATPLRVGQRSGPRADAARGRQVGAAVQKQPCDVTVATPSCPHERGLAILRLSTRARQQSCMSQPRSCCTTATVADRLARSYAALGLDVGSPAQKHVYNRGLACASSPNKGRPSELHPGRRSRCVAQHGRWTRRTKRRPSHPKPTAALAGKHLAPEPVAAARSRPRG